MGLIDIDNFKKLNDSLGHTAGDHALKTLARGGARTAAAGDHLARFGGEEFVVLLPRTETVEAQQTLTRLQRGLTEALFLYEGREVFVTFSAGVTTWRPARCWRRPSSAPTRLCTRPSALARTVPAWPERPWRRRQRGMRCVSGCEVRTRLHISPQFGAAEVDSLSKGRFIRPATRLDHHEFIPQPVRSPAPGGNGILRQEVALRRGENGVHVVLQERAGRGDRKRQPPRDEATAKKEAANWP